MATATKINNFDWVCRTCMQELREVASFDANPEPQQQWQSIIDTIEECGSLRITELISNTIKHVKVPLSDELPKKICRECLQTLQSAYQFQQTCLKTQQNLQAEISKHTADLLTSLNETTSEDGNKVHEDVKQEVLSEAGNVETEFEYVNATTASPTETAAKVEISLNEFLNQDHSINSQDVLSEFVKTEPCDDEEWNVGEFVTNEPGIGDGFAGDDTSNSTNTVNNKVLLVDTEEDQVSLETPTHDCHLCNKSFKKRTYLKAHLKRHNNVDEEIQQDAASEPGIVTDEALHSTDTVRTIEINGQQITVRSSTIKCHICSKTLKTKGALAMHLNWHSRINYMEPKDKEKLDKSLPKHVCDLCKQCFCSSFSLKRHKRLRHSGNKPNKRARPVQCEMCPKTCSELSSLYRHIKSQHSREKELKKSKYVCNNCGEAFLNQSTLTFHELQFNCSTDQSKQKTNDESIKPNVCEICKKIFENRDRLKHHFKYVHNTTERAYECDKCGKAFKTKGHLNRHISSHSSEKPYECPLCPCRFSCLGNLSKHKHRHAVLKRFICDICAYSSASSTELKHHKTTHSGEKPYKCDICEMRFPRPQAKRRHMRTHTGEKPYKCKYCERAYAQSGDHIKHLRTHVGENVYRCDLCPLAFPLLIEKRSHFATHKNEDPETRERNMKALKEEEAKLMFKLTGKDI